MFAKSKQEELEQVAKEMRARLQSDRDFWDSCVQYMMDEETVGESKTKQVIASADQLLEARRARFPL